MSLGPGWHDPIADESTLAASLGFDLRRMQGLWSGGLFLGPHSGGAGNPGGALAKESSASAVKKSRVVTNTAMIPWDFWIFLGWQTMLYYSLFFIIYNLEKLWLDARISTQEMLLEGGVLTKIQVR